VSLTKEKVVFNTNTRLRLPGMWRSLLVQVGDQGPLPEEMLRTNFELGEGTDLSGVNETQ